MIKKKRFNIEIKYNYVNQLKQNHYQLLMKQINDRKENCNENKEIKKILKTNIDKNVNLNFIQIEDQNVFNNEMKDKENELKQFYRKCLANQVKITLNFSFWKKN